jgi:putative N6-adenine-specific DNA methylase
LVAGELERIGVRPGRHIRGGVEFGATTRQLYAANVWLRTATRVVVRVATFTATSFRSLEQQAAGVEWDRWLADGVEPDLRVTSIKSKLYHTDAVAERLRRVAAPSTTGATEHQRFVVRVDHDVVTISADASGRPLHQRGWRGPHAKAPLRETSAAALLLAAGWDGGSPLLDPMCGSGTIAIEASTIARGQAPGWQREFAFGQWPSFEPGTWASVAADAAASVRPHAGVAIVASDRDEGAVDATRRNAEHAGVAGDLTLRRASISELVRPTDNDPGWLITNPPYGKRASAGRDLRDLFARLGQVARAELPGWSIALLVHDRRLATHTGLAMVERLSFANGGLTVHLLTADVP